MSVQQRSMGDVRKKEKVVDPTSDDEAVLPVDKIADDAAAESDIVEAAQLPAAQLPAAGARPGRRMAALQTREEAPPDGFDMAVAEKRSKAAAAMPKRPKVQAECTAEQVRAGLQRIHRQRMQASADARAKTAHQLFDAPQVKKQRTVAQVRQQKLSEMRRKHKKHDNAEDAAETLASDDKEDADDKANVEVGDKRERPGKQMQKAPEKPTDTVRVRLPSTWLCPSNAKDSRCYKSKVLVDDKVNVQAYYEVVLTCMGEKMQANPMPAVNVTTSFYRERYCYVVLGDMQNGLGDGTRCEAPGEELLCYWSFPALPLLKAFQVHIGVVHPDKKQMPDATVRKWLKDRMLRSQHCMIGNFIYLKLDSNGIPKPCTVLRVKPISGKNYDPKLDQSDIDDSDDENYSLDSSDIQSSCDADSESSESENSDRCSAASSSESSDSCNGGEDATSVADGESSGGDGAAGSGDTFYLQAAGNRKADTDSEGGPDSDLSAGEASDA